MTLYDIKYIEIIKNVMENGYYDNNRTGISTKKLPHQIMQFNLEQEFPILSTKFVAFKTAVKEMLWIYQQQSNVVEDLRKQNVRIWNEWELEDGTIGKAYGYQVKKFNQIDKLIEALKNNPQDRRMMLNLWNFSDLPEMALAPCCFLTMWDVTDGRLNCMLVQRSGDLPLGVPFNTTQFAVLTHMLAQVCGLKVGMLTHVINNAHIYENQFEGMKEQINRFEELGKYEGNVYWGIKCDEYKYDIEVMEKINGINPKLWLNPDITNFYDFTIDDVRLDNYNHMGSIKMEVAV